MPRYSVRLVHPTYVIQSCPSCTFPEADGGYCPECGWQEYDPSCPHCVKAAAPKGARRRKENDGP